MNDNWCCVDNHLCIQSKGELFHLNAEEIYSCFDAEKNPFGFECADPRVALKEVRFSSIGSPLKCRLFADEKANIFIELFVIRRKEKINVDLIDGTIIDQVCTGSEWFHVTGDIQIIESCLKTTGITTLGKITFKQYIELIDPVMNKFTSIFENNVDATVQEKQIDQIGKREVSLNGQLYPYQETGFRWMSFMLGESCGCILGDEMGLGKTLQAIAVMADYANNSKIPMLVIAPVSLLENWKRECDKFAPNLDVYIHHGSKRTGVYSELQNHDVVVISYNTAVSDLSLLRMINWKLVILDEAQSIKNYQSERSKSVKKILKEGAIAITGTPFENHITDIWSIVDFIMPGYLGTVGQFKSTVSDDVSGAEIVEPLLSPVMIRRLVKNVAQDLPEKVIIPQPIQMPENEARRYEEYRQEIASEYQDAAVTIATLQKLRMFCTHPGLCEEQFVDPAQCSLKYQRFCEILQEIIDTKDKVIVFTSYKKMFDIFRTDLTKRFTLPVWEINGETPVPERQKIVDMFNDYSGSAVLALNPRAAGTGLNITGANHVVHYNLEWNPALEDQASARAYRRGQQKTVFVYRLFYSDTVEEVVNQRIENKREISEIAVVGTEGTTDNRADILAALQKSPMR